MKLLKRMRVAFVALAASLCMMPMAAFAAPGVGGPAVVYDGAAKAWHGENLQPSDVLADFSEVMPGDVLTQEFALEARNVQREVTVYLRVSADAETVRALAEVPFRVIETADAGGQETVVAEGVLGEIADAAKPAAKIATFTADGSMPLRIELSVPTSFGNEYQNKAYAPEWVFIAQEEGGGTGPDKPVDPDRPVDPDEPDEPVDPDEPTDPDEPAGPDEPTGPDGSGDGGAGDGSASSGSGGSGGGAVSATSSDLLNKTNDASAGMAAVFAIVGIVAAALVVVAIIRLKGGRRR